MAQDTFHLIALKSTSDLDSLAPKLVRLSASKQLRWFGRVHFWLHEPRNAPEGHLRKGDHLIQWQYLLVGDKSLPLLLEDDLQEVWSLTAPRLEDAPLIDVKAKTLQGRQGPSLPIGWSVDDHTQFDAAQAPEGLVLTLEESSHVFGQSVTSDKTKLKNLIRDFGSEHPGPIAVFGLLRYQSPSGRQTYLEKYLAGFTQDLNPLYGNDAYSVGLGVTEYTTMATEEASEHPIEDMALVWYPSIWHFAKMLDDARYAELDRMFKVSSVWDNPLMCCTEIRLEEN